MRSNHSIPNQPQPTRWSSCSGINLRMRGFLFGISSDGGKPQPGFVMWYLTKEAGR
ncbi:MAG: hypothetical protein K9N23_04600 [Akkermansiaceae bacterium]|nr:hypothetical protein [Akkermansiaceae bacterium]